MSANFNSLRTIDSKKNLASKLERFEIFYTHSYEKEGRVVIISECIENVQFHYSIIELEPLIDSSEIQIELIMKIYDVLRIHFQFYDYFLVIHGTDTMEHTSSAISFLIKNLSKPIIFTGSQVPLLYANNDAFNNFYNSLASFGELKSKMSYK